MWQKCAYMFNVYKNQPSRQTGSRNLTGPKTLPTIWHTYMKLVTKYQKRFWTHQIPTSCLPTLLIFIHIGHTFCIWPFLVAFFSTTIDGRNLIFGHKLHIGTPYRGKRFLTRQIPASCLPKSGGIISNLVIFWQIITFLLHGFCFVCESLFFL
jgi:hypothetical protein